MKTFSRFVRAASALLLAASALPALADIPAAERNVLIDLYNSTHGDSWTDNTGWKAAPLAGDGFQDTVCGAATAWHGIVCDGTDTHVMQISLAGNNLAGSIPSLTNLSALVFLTVNDNHLTGSIPALPATLLIVNASNNQLTGSIPSLAGLTQLQTFAASNNQLTGSIPSLSGLPKLVTFYADHNLLTGAIPSPLPATLEFFRINNNQRLTGAPPAAPASLLAGGSQLCPNYLQPSATASINADWDAATGESPWSQNCTAAPVATTVAAVPTLETAGLALLALLLAGGAAARMRRS